MTPSETVHLVRLVRQIAPAQKFDEYTPEAWHLLLEHIPLCDALEALKHVGQRNAWIAPRDILYEAKRLRRARLEHADATFVYTGDPEDTAEYLLQLRTHYGALAAGRTPSARPEIPRRPLPRQIANTFRSLRKDTAKATIEIHHE